jgi:hypothetical protein
MADDVGATGKGNVVAIDEAMERWHREADEEDAQFGLFAEPQTEAGKAKALAYRRGPGRPPGARNRRTERTAAFLLARHRHPIEVLLEIAEANVADLAGFLNCTMMEAAQEKRLAASAVLPYLASRMPLEIDLSKKSVVYLTIVDGHAAQTSAEDGIAMQMKIVEGVNYTRVYGPADSEQ